MRPMQRQSSLIGQTISHYQILEKVGEGGMGIVYKARDLHLDRFVALKLLPLESVTDVTRRQRFVQEAKSASALNHPNIIHIYDVNEIEGTLFLAMEYVSGRTLSQVIARNRLALGEGLKIATQIAEALAKAHAAGIVHRDLKPSNIMVTEDGLVKVLDFGLAKLTEPTSDDSIETQSAKYYGPPRTEEGVILGTASYMSPEQAEGKPVDGRSDIFSFGTVLYEVFSGNRAFQGDSQMRTVAKVLHDEPPPLRNAVPNLPPELERLIARCMRKDPERRLRSMADLKVALEELKEDSDSGRLVTEKSKADPSLRSKRKWLYVAAVGGAFAVAALWYLLPGTMKPSPKVKVAQLTSNVGDEMSPTFSPDGNQIAYSWDGENQDESHIYVKLIGPGPPLQLTKEPALDSWPSWSPDGQAIAFLRDLGSAKYGVYVIPALGGQEQKLLDAFIPETEWLPGPYLAWSPDSKWIIYTHKDAPELPTGLFTVQKESREIRRLTTAPPGTMGDSAPAVSPDGSKLVFSRVTGIGPTDLYLVEVKKDYSPAQDPQRISFFNWVLAGAAWTPKGTNIIFSHEQELWKVPFSGNGGIKSRPQKIESFGNGATSPAIARQGNRMAFVKAYGGPLNIWRVGLDRGTDSIEKNNKANEAADLLPSTKEEFSPQYSPDGKKIAFESDRTGSLEIWTCLSNGTNCSMLTSFGTQVTGVPHWSPDGQQIAFYSRPQDNAQIYVMNSEGGGLRRLTNDKWENFFPVWSRDQRWIYFASNRTGQDQIWKLQPGGGEPVQVTKNGGFACAESPDGKYLYYTRSREPIGSIWKMPVGGGEETKIVDGVVIFNFAVTTRGLYYMSQPDTASKNKRVNFVSFADQKTRVVATIPQDVYHGFSISPDDRWLLYAPNGRGGSNVMVAETFDLDAVQ
jgi:eukaryotic-like serine/threonine-protein kinase